ncbi:hypothetical protein G432_05195 [Sphingomonas sp. MM-1]|uniref:hypothetical protein n=1 Tax=Sphingomonas sp. MM-1 TaxID=745310 RepID=UPI0002C14904|nr:hypothetical protein [Sphingomonas sp. MM-1]AGH48766.1 hypothetical protein G432_05195 [Sphingomonas sp. MM-1]
MAGGKSGVDWASARRMRGMIKRLTPEARAEMIVEMNLVGDDELARMRRDVSRRSGFLASGLSKKVYPKSLRLRVGFIGKKVNRDRWYRWIIERGRKAKTVEVNRRRGRTAPASYPLRVKAMRARPYVFSGGGAARIARSQRLQDFWGKVLTRVGAGGAL